MYLLRILFFVASVSLFATGGAGAQTCPSYPNTLTNGTTADANAVMGNFNAILNCANNNLASSSGGTLNNSNLNGTTVVQKLQFPDGTTQTTASQQFVSVRQTVMTGPAAAGLPTFLPPTSPSLSLPAQNVSSASPLVVTAAQGFGAAGASNPVYQFTSNPAWTLAANAVNYLYINALTGATGFTTLKPIYQFGGTVAITNGQFTFDYQAMVGYLGNGSTAPPTPLVFVGEVVAGASTITSTIAYAYNGIYDSGLTATLPSAGTAISKAASLGVENGVVTLRFQNTTAEAGYAVGDVITNITTTGTAGYPGAVATWATRLNAGFTAGAGSAWSAVNKSTGVGINLTLANWSYAVSVRRPWGGS